MTLYDQIRELLDTAQFDHCAAQEDTEDLREVIGELVSALRGVLAASEAIANAAPNALAGIPNARDLHLADVAARERARIILSGLDGLYLKEQGE